MTDYFDFEVEQALFYNTSYDEADNHLMLLNQRHCLYYCADTAQIIMCASSEFNGQRYMCVKTLSLEEFRQPLIKDEIKGELIYNLLTSIRNALTDYRSRRRRYNENPIMIYRWVGIAKEMLRVESHDVNLHMANRMINDLNAAPMYPSRILKHTPVEKINWRKEGF